MRLLWMLLLLAACCPFPALAADSDGDGLADDVEQAVLEKFAPSFLVSRNDCDQLPAEFQAGAAEPHVVARNGTVYGQVFTSPLADPRNFAVEIHYYTLWARDCGRMSHDLDTEHVSALVAAPSPEASLSEWRAVYWYAAAHEGTPCDGSNAAPAGAVKAETGGARVWISRGKHAAYLSPDLCSRGCGSNHCSDDVPMTIAAILNIGEPGRPLAGAAWSASTRWPLAEKMTPDFTPELARKLRSLHDAPHGVAGPVPPTKALLLGGNSTLTGAGVGIREGGLALGTGGKHGGKSLWRGLSAVGRALRSSFSAIGIR